MRLRAPGPDADPRETLAWVRRFELITGVANLGLAIFFWDHETVRWVLLGVGLLGLSPWPGAAAVLRKAERNPEILVTDPERRRLRARRIALVQVPLYVVAGGLVGYAIDGWSFAIVLALVMGACAGVVSVRMLRWR